MDQKKIPWSGITAYLRGEATVLQKQQLKDWLAASPEHLVILDEIIRTWQITKGGDSSYTPDEQKLWTQLIQRIGHKQNKNLILHPVKKWLTVAAALLLVFFIGNWYGGDGFRLREKTTYSTIVAPSGSKSQIYLPDGTKVWLNSGAQLKYSSSYTAIKREVFIQGECFFDVTKSNKNHFLVNTSNSKIKVLGTKFNVKADIKASTTSVTLVSGKVQVLNKSDDELAVLKPGEHLVLENYQYTVEKLSRVVTITAWTRNILTFDNQPFDEVVAYLESWFGVEIDLDPSLIHKGSYTFKTKTESLREVLDMISIITPVDYKIDGDKVKINPKEQK